MCEPSPRGSFVRTGWFQLISSAPPKRRGENMAFGKAEPGLTTVYESKKTNLRRAARQNVPGISTQQSGFLTH